MINLIGPQFSRTAQQTRNMVAGMERTLQTLQLLPHQTVGLYLDISLESVALLLACMNQGLKVAICPVREPALVVNAWLKELEVANVLSPRPAHQGIEVSWLQVSIENAGGAEVAHKSESFATILRTSGTTAQPKSAVILDQAHRASAQSVNRYFNVGPTSCFLLSLPLYHVSGLSIIYRSLLSGASIVFAQSFDELVHRIQQHSITHLSLVPAQLKRLLDQNLAMSHLQAVIIGGDALPVDLCTRALQVGVPLYETYGLTETASMIWVRDCRTNQTSVLPHAKLIVADDNEILVGGESLFLGYQSAPNGMVRPLHDGLFATGDVATNQLQLIVRKHNRIISGGENIQAEEVEAALERHPAIEKAVVVGVLDRNLGMRPRAYVKWAGEPLAHQHLLDYLKQYLASYKCPKELLPWPEHAPQTLKKPRQWFLTNLS